MDENINDWISKKITSNDVVLFMKGTPETPQNPEIPGFPGFREFSLNSPVGPYWALRALASVRRCPTLSDAEQNKPKLPANCLMLLGV